MPTRSNEIIGSRELRDNRFHRPAFFRPAKTVQNSAELGAPGDEYNKSPCRKGSAGLLEDKNHHPLRSREYCQIPFFPSRCLVLSDWTAFPASVNVVQSERSNQRDGLRLAHMNLASYALQSLEYCGILISSRASSGPFGWIFDWKVREES